MIIEGVPKRDIDQHYTLTDVLDHNDALDLQRNADEEAHERAMESARGK